jgi:carboxylesterase
MLEYILSFLAIISIYKGIRIFLGWIKPKKINKNIIKGAELFFYKKGKVGILLIHGFSSTPHDLRELGKFLSNRDITVYAPLLKGHGTSVEDMATTTYKDWFGSAEKALLKLKKYSKKVFISGISAMGNLCILLAVKHKVDGIILMGMPINFKRQRLVNVASIILPFLKKVKKYQNKWYHRDVEKEIIKKRITYNKISLKSAHEAIKMINHSIKLLPKIRAPILIMQSTTDIQVSDNSPKYIYDHVSSNYKKIVWIPDSYHVFVVDKNKLTAFREISNFIRDNIKINFDTKKH